MKDRLKTAVMAGGMPKTQNCKPDIGQQVEKQINTESPRRNRNRGQVKGDGGQPVEAVKSQKAPFLFFWQNAEGMGEDHAVADEHGNTHCKINNIFYGRIFLIKSRKRI